MGATERVTQFLDYKGITKYKFCKDLGFSNKFLDNSVNMGTDKASKILHYFPDLNPEWLLTGNGSMVLSASKSNVVKEPTTDYANSNLIPMYDDVHTIGGANSIANIDPVTKPTEYIDAGDWFPGASAAIRHYGDSMTEYPSGCILALKEVNDRNLIFWGSNYCIETTEGRITKRLQKGACSESVTAYSSNQETYADGRLVHEPIEIPHESIRRLYQVMGYVVKEYSNGTVKIVK